MGLQTASDTVVLSLKRFPTSSLSITPSAFPCFSFYKLGIPASSCCAQLCARSLISSTVSVGSTTRVQGRTHLHPSSVCSPKLQVADPRPSDLGTAQTPSPSARVSSPFLCLHLTRMSASSSGRSMQCLLQRLRHAMPFDFTSKHLLSPAPPTLPFTP